MVLDDCHMATTITCNKFCQLLYITDHAVFFLDGKSLKLTGSFLSDCLLKTKTVLARKDSESGIEN